MLGELEVVRVPAIGSGPLVLLTIDTEEEGRWGGGYPREGATCENIPRLAALDDLCREFGLRPTLLTTYPVACDARSREFLLGWCERNRGEIGAHLHPWCNPPYHEVDRTCTYAGNLPETVLEAKLGQLTGTLTDSFGSRPTSFRAGRWGISGKTLQLLERFGYTVDSSVVPLHWESEPGGPSFLEAPFVPYVPHGEAPTRRGRMNLVEAPVTTVMTGPLGPIVGRMRAVLRPVRGLATILDRLGRCWLRPSWGDARTLARATRTCLASGYPVINIMFHSSELLPGASPYVRDDAELRAFLVRLRSIVATAFEHPGARAGVLREVGDDGDSGARP